MPETPGPAARARARDATAPVRDPDLRAALEELGSHVLSRTGPGRPG